VILCLCFGVSDRLVRQRARDGVSLGALLEESGAGSSCGACRLAIARVHAGERAAPPRCGSRAALLEEAA
jgi:bacterioferritin-associated ferredoxin